MKKVKYYCAILMVFAVLVGCESNSESTKNKDTISYSYEEVDGVITDIDIKHWFATCPRWQWEISVEYEGMMFDDCGYSNGMLNEPSFSNSKPGDSIKLEICTKYINGNISDRYISEIK